MNGELADYIVGIAAPIYASLLIPVVNAYGSDVIPAEVLEQVRRAAITQALALRKQAIEWST
jgi:hypothetical protein